MSVLWTACGGWRHHPRLPQRLHGVDTPEKAQAFGT